MKQFEFSEICLSNSFNVHKVAPRFRTFSKIHIFVVVTISSRFDVRILKKKRGAILLTQRECARLQGFPESFIVDACRQKEPASSVCGRAAKRARTAEASGGGGGVGDGGGGSADGGDGGSINGVNEFYSQAGNSVAVPVVQAIATALVRVL